MDNLPIGNIGNSTPHEMRALYLRRMPAIVESLMQLHSDAKPEVQGILRKLHDVVSVADQPAQGDPADALRAPLDDLRAVIDRRAFIFVTPELLQLLCYLRHFIATTIGVVTDGLLPKPAPTAIVAPRVQLQQPLPPTSTNRRSALDFLSQRVFLPSRQQQQTPQKRALPIVADDSCAPTVVKQFKTPKKETEKCDHCDLIIDVDETNQFKHMWKKHKDQVYKFIKPDLVCSSVPYCDYVASSVHARKIHEGRDHGKFPAAQDDIIQDFEKGGKCPYCKAGVDKIGYVKKHMEICTKRDQRPLLGCSACPDEKFHFIYDFTNHLGTKGGVTHGKPVLL